MGITEREANMIIESIAEIKEILRESVRQLREELHGNREDSSKNLNSINTLLQTHNGRMDNIELTQVEIRMWIKSEESKRNNIEKKNSWFYPMVIASLLSLAAIIIALLTK